MKIGDRIKSTKFPEHGVGLVVGFNDSSHVGTLIAVRFEDCKTYIDTFDEPDCHYVAYEDAVLVEKVEENDWGTVLGGMAAALIGASLIKKATNKDKNFSFQDKKHQETL